MLGRIILSIVVGVAVALVCLLLGTILAAVSISWVAAIGSFLKSYSGLIGLLAALWFFFTGRTSLPV